MKKEIVMLTIAEKNFVYGGCTCKCNQAQPVCDSYSNEHGCHHEHGHHAHGCHGHSTHIMQPIMVEYTVGEASSISECSTVCNRNGDTMSSCL